AGSDSRLLTGPVGIGPVVTLIKRYGVLIAKTNVYRKLLRYPPIVLREHIPIVTVDTTVVGTALIRADRLTNQKVGKSVLRSGTVENEVSIRSRGGAIDHLHKLEFAAELRGVPATEPAHAVAKVVHIAMLQVMQPGI